MPFHRNRTGGHRVRIEDLQLLHGNGHCVHFTYSVWEPRICITTHVNALNCQADHFATFAQAAEQKDRQKSKGWKVKKTLPGHQPGRERPGEPRSQKIPPLRPADYLGRTASEHLQVFT